MKAKEYFNKYRASLMEAHDSPDADLRKNVANEIYGEFVSELDSIVKARNIKFDKGALSAIRELNQKWNAVVDLFVKEYGFSPLKRDGFLRAVYKQIGIPMETNGASNVA